MNVTRKGKCFYLVFVYVKYSQGNFRMIISFLLLVFTRHQRFKDFPLKTAILLNFNYANDVQLFDKYFFCNL